MPIGQLPLALRANESFPTMEWFAGCWTRFPQMIEYRKVAQVFEDAENQRLATDSDVGSEGVISLAYICVL